MSTLPLLKAIASSDGFQTGYGGEIVATRLDGPSVSQRKGYVGGGRIASVKWELDPLGYQYIMAFYRKKTRRGVLPFLIDVLGNEALPVRHIGNIVPGTFSLDSRQGLKYTVIATVELSRQGEVTAEDVVDD